MAGKAYLERTWIGTTPGGSTVRVEEYRRDLAYLVEYYDANSDDTHDPIFHCPVTGETLTPTILQPEEKLQEAVFGLA